MTTTRAKHGSVRPRMDRATLAGLVVVGLAAAVLSFVSLTELGMRAGYPAGLAVLLPVAIDAQAAVAARAWLAPATPARARRYARGLALAAVAVSIAGNAGEHAMAAYAVTAPWWVVVAVSAIPPAALAATAHLAALVTPTTGPTVGSTTGATVGVDVTPTETATEVAVGADGDGDEAATGLGGRVDRDRPDQPSDLPESTPITPDASGSVDPDARTGRPAGDGDESAPTVEGSSGLSGRVDSTGSTATAATQSTSRRRGRSGRSMEQLRAELAAAVEADQVDPTSATSIRTALSCSAARARQLRDELTTSPTSTPATAPRLAVVGQEDSR